MMLFNSFQFRRRFFQYLAAIGVNLGMLSIGMHYGWLSISLQTLTSGNYSFQITNDESSWLASTVPIGSGFGDVIAALTTNIYGRKTLVTFSVIPLSLAWILVAAAPSVVYMFVGRFIGGLMDGVLFTAVPSYLAEISDPEIRGFLGSTYAVTIVGGMLLMNTMLYFLPMQTACYIAASISVPMLFVLPWLPDSAYFYLLNDRPEEATASLQKYRGQGDVQKEFSRISDSIKGELENGGKLTDLFLIRNNRKALILSIILCILVQLVGINPILSYCTQVFGSTSNIMSPDLSNFVYYIVYFIISTISIFIVDISGRRILLIISAFGSAVTLFGIATFLYIQNNTNLDISNYEYIQSILVFLYIILFSVGLQTVPILMISELFASNVKGLGLCLTNISFSVSITVALKFFSWTTDLFGMHVPFYFFGAISVMLIIFVKFLPETSGKTLEQVQQELAYKKPPK